jgi:hypothetical protein
MKSKTMSYVAIGIFIVLSSLVYWTAIGFTNDKAEIQGLSFKAKANKETYALGEPVKVEFEFSNEGEKPIIIFSGGVETGSLKVLIAGKDKEFKEYFASGWGRKRGYKINLEPKQAQKYEAVILWNGKPNVSHLNEDAAKRVLEGKVTTEYAFPEPGVYLIKAVSYVGENATQVESKPAQIIINEPVGDDLQVWNQIKGNREIAYLLQKGEFQTSEDEEKTGLLAEVEQLVQKYPNSIYSGYLRQNLEKFQANEERRKRFVEKLKQPR